jgi:tripartite-type tricarboxylate transporter receptor subunit TctC
MNRRLCIHTAILAATIALAGAPSATRADDAYPSKPVKIVIGFAAGSGTDITARMIAQELQKSLNQPFVVENRPGAAAQIAATLVKAAAPDGYTLLLASSASHSVNPHLFKSLPYDPITDFTPIGGVAGIPWIVAVNSDSPVKTLPELVSWARAKKEKAFYGYSGSIFRVPAEVINRTQQLGATGVPFKSSPEKMTELIAGRLDFMVVDLAASQPHLLSKRLRALAVTTGKRSALAPELPTVEEALGIPEFDMSSWTGLFGPANMPKPIVDKLSAALVKILERPDMKQRMLASNLEPMPSDPVVFSNMVKRQLRSWGVKVKYAGIEPE